jgi:hypothetical protein
MLGSLVEVPGLADHAGAQYGTTPQTHERGHEVEGVLCESDAAMGKT